MKPLIKKIIELYTDNKIAQLLTAENMIQKAMGQNVYLRGKSLETYDKLFKERETDIETNTTKKAAAATKIGRAIRGNVTFAVTRKTAFRDGAVELIVKPLTVGSALSTDIPAFVARSYLVARKQIPRNASFTVFASCRYDYRTQEGGVLNMHPVATPKYESNKLREFFTDLVKRIECEYGTIVLKSMVFEYHFAVIPSGAGWGTTSRDVDSVMKKSPFYKSRTMIRIASGMLCPAY